jgi:ribosome biogenesis GTPase A
MLISSATKGARNRVDLSSKELTRQWRKHFGTSKEKIEAAIAKVGDNPESVQKQLRAETD